MTENAIELARQVLQQEAESILNLRDRIDDGFIKAVELILNSKGRLLVLGVGKSGHIGRKIAATLASTGQPSFFIHPTEAVHGDLGMMVQGDVCLMISHSGNTAEIIDTIPAIKRLGLRIIGMTSIIDSKLGKYSDVILNTYVKREACPLNLSPTNSTTVSLAYGDALAITLLRMKGFKAEQFARRHPGGILGKRLLLKVSDMMISDNLPINHKKDSFRDALARMTLGRQGVTIIVDDSGNCVGILTDGDLRRTLEKYDRVSEIELEKIYTRNPKSISIDSLAMEALTKMQNNKITSLVVVNGSEEVVGLIHIHHLLEQGFY